MASYSHPTTNLPFDNLPSMPGYGYLDNTRIVGPEPQLPPVQSPQQVQQFYDNQPKPTLPDTVTARFGWGDKTTVGNLLAAANNQDNALVGVSPTLAASLLTSWGYPTQADAWTAKQWADALGASAATKPSPLSLLGY